MELTGSSGIFTDNNTTVLDCTVHEAGFDGISVAAHCRVEGCVVNVTQSDGILIERLTIVKGNNVDLPNLGANAGAAGIRATVGLNTIDGNQVMEYLGIEPGPTVGEVMRMLYERRIEEGPYTEAEAFAMLDEWKSQEDHP